MTNDRTLNGASLAELKTCPLPSKTQLEKKSGRPVICQLKGGAETPVRHTVFSVFSGKRRVPVPRRRLLREEDGFLLHKGNFSFRAFRSIDDCPLQVTDAEKKKAKLTKEVEEEEKPSTLEELIERGVGGKGGRG